MDNKNRLVSVAMPSEKDLEVMEETIVTLKSFGISYEVTVISAHRSPEQMFEYIKNANDRGIVIIATASGAAHLPGMIAALTTLPVIVIFSRRIGLCSFYVTNAKWSSCCYGVSQRC